MQPTFALLHTVLHGCRQQSHSLSQWIAFHIWRGTTDICFSSDRQHQSECGQYLPSLSCIVMQSTYGIASAARSAVLISRHAKAAAAHRAAMEEAEPSA